MNSRKKLLRYLEKNNGFNVNRDIYENYEKGYIKKRVNKWKNITSEKRNSETANQSK